MKHILQGFMVSALLFAAWFVTMIGGWGEVARAIAGEPDAPFDDADVEVLVGAPLPGGDELGMPTRLDVEGDELLVLDRFRREAIVALDRHSGRLLRSFGTEGDGPGEFRSPVAFVPDARGVAVLDVGWNRVTWLASEPEAFGLLATKQFLVDFPATDLVPTPGGDFLVLGFTGDGRLARLSPAGRFLGYEGSPVEVENLPPERRIEALQGTLRAAPGGDRLVRTHRFASRLEVIDLETSTSTEIWGHERFAPERGNDYRTRFGYLDSAPMTDGVLALYSGRTREDYPERANYASVVHEFGWDGRPRREYRLDADVIAITWSMADRLLYAARHEPVPSIVVYELDR